jgi:valyl-tRNA synthetase
MGHFLNITVQDVLCRWQAQRGKECFWAAMMDHGGHATQLVLERGAACHGARRTELDEHDLDVLRKIEAAILEQLLVFGTRLDMSAYVNILEERAVRLMQACITELHEKGFIQRRSLVVPWSRAYATPVAPHECESREVEALEYLVRYRTHDPPREILVWLDAPELLRGEAALALSKEYADEHRLSEGTCENPLGQEVPLLILEGSWQGSRASGVLSVVPGHDRESYAIARNHGLPIVRVFDETTPVESQPEEYRRALAAERLRIVERIRERKCLADTRATRRDERVFKLDNTPVTQLLTEQYYLSVSGLVETALELLRTAAVRVYPKIYETALRLWLEQAATIVPGATGMFPYGEWCLTASRAIGVPWPTLEAEVPPHLRKCVLETQFSCALWTFCAHSIYSSEELTFSRLAKATTCVAGYDVLFFWFIPNILLAGALDRGLPFASVVVHSLVCDEGGRKMSKSEGNILDPCTLIDAYGLDAVRIALMQQLDPSAKELRFDGRPLAGISRRLEAFGALFARDAGEDVDDDEAPSTVRSLDLSARLEAFDFAGGASDTLAFIDAALASGEAPCGRSAAERAQMLENLAIYAPQTASKIRRAAPNADGEP